jgi:acid phosphatase type 7
VLQVPVRRLPVVRVPAPRLPAAHSFGRPRPGADGAFALHLDAERNTSFRPLPPPTGRAPYQLNLKSIISPVDYQTIVQKKKLTFHLNGDMGGIKYGVPQELVARGMEADISTTGDTSENPAFL